MDHAGAHERIADLALEPDRLASLATSPAPEDIALREHLARCGECRTELDAWLRLHGSLDDALGGSAPGPTGAGRDLPTAARAAAASVTPVPPPDELRGRVLAAVRGTSIAAPAVAGAGGSRPTGVDGRSGTGGLRRLRGSLAIRAVGWLAAAAAAIAIVIGAGLLRDRDARLQASTGQAAALAEVVATVDRVLAAPGHRVASLNEPDGDAAGSIAWTQHDLVVLTAALAAPAQGQVYRCWLNDSGKAWAVGVMEFAGDTGYWVGTLDEWASWEIGPEALFRVSLEPAGADPTHRSGPIVLEAALGS
jgi:hypothetical protein